MRVFAYNGKSKYVMIDLTIDEARNLVYDPSVSGVLVDMLEEIKAELREAGLWHQD